MDCRVDEVLTAGSELQVLCDLKHVAVVAKDAEKGNPRLARQIRTRMPVAVHRKPLMSPLFCQSPAPTAQ